MDKDVAMARVSVIMPVYNGEKYLEAAINSILSQTFSDFEFLIVDDGSTDGSRRIIESYSDARIRVVHHTKNLGLVETLNRSLNMVSGEYIARMDSDDISEPRRFELQVSWLDEQSDCDVIASRVDQIDCDSHPLPPWELDFKTTTRASIRSTLPETNCIAHPSIMARRRVLLGNPYRHSALHAEDYELWLRLTSQGHNIDKLTIPVLKYRVHPKSVTSQSNSTGWQASSKLIRAKLIFLFDSARHFRWTVFEWMTFFSVFRFLKSLIGGIVRKALKHTLGLSAFRIGQASAVLHPRVFGTELLLFFPHYHVGGAEKVHVDIATNLKDEQPVIFITYPSNDSSELKNFRSAGTVIEFGVLLHFKLIEFFLLGRMSAAINRDQAVKTIAGSNNHFFYQLLPHLRRNLRKVDLLHTYGSGIEEYTLPFAKYLDRRIVINENVRIGLRQQYKFRQQDKDLASRICVIENRIVLPQGPFDKASLPPLKVLYVGRGSIEKRIDLIAQVAESCAQSDIKTQFTFVGPKIEPWISSERMRYCRFSGVLTDQTLLERQYRDAHVIILLSAFEGFPVVVMEGMACGVVPLVTNVGGLNVHVKHGVTGFLIENSANEQQIVSDSVKVLLKLARSPQLFEQLSQACAIYAQKHFAQPGYREKYREAILGEKIDL